MPPCKDARLNADPNNEMNFYKFPVSKVVAKTAYFPSTSNNMANVYRSRQMGAGATNMPILSHAMPLLHRPGTNYTSLD